MALNSLFFGIHHAFYSSETSLISIHLPRRETRIQSNHHISECITAGTFSNSATRHHKKNFFRNNSCYLAGRVQLRFFHLYQITDFRGIEDMVGISRNKTKNPVSKCRRQSDCATPRSWPNKEKIKFLILR